MMLTLTTLSSSPALAEHTFLQLVRTYGLVERVMAGLGGEEWVQLDRLLVQMSEHLAVLAERADD